MLTCSNENSYGSFKTNPTILQVIPAYGSGGVEVESLEIAKAIALAGGRALVAGAFSNQDKSLAAIPPEVKFINLPLDTKNPLQIIRNIKILKDVIQKEKVTIVHARSRAPAWSAYMVTKSLKIPFITTYHAAYGSKGVLKTLYNSVMARGDCVIAISKFIQHHITEKYQSYSWFNPSKVRLIERGIDLDYFDPSAISQERVNSLRKSWEISPHMRLILLPGRISRSKGHKVLLHALSLMEETNVMALFVGSANNHETYRNELLQEASSLGLEGRVKWFSPCSDIAAAYKLADVIVCPSLVPEGFGRLMAESQAMKKPIIASNLGAAPEVIGEEIGCLIPPNDAAALAQALDEKLRLPQEQLEILGNKSRERMKAFFSKERMFAKTVEVYKEVLKKTMHERA